MWVVVASATGTVVPGVARLGLRSLVGFEEVSGRVGLGLIAATAGHLGSRCNGARRTAGCTEAGASYEVSSSGRSSWSREETVIAEVWSESLLIKIEVDRRVKRKNSSE